MTNYTPNALNQYSSISGGGFQPPSPTYDDDGNQIDAQVLPLRSSSLESCVFSLDTENRLISTTVNSVTTTYLYDSQSRRIAQTVGTGSPSGPMTVYIYDGWNPIAQYSIQNSTFIIQNSFTWGMDLSGSMQGAGGVGGLLAVTDTTESYFSTFDGNGNISEYLDTTGAIAAHYEYDPFGRETVANGTNPSGFAHRFSTKPLDTANGLLYYGYRWYDPATGRWPSRDPIGESGGINLYGFVGNDGVNKWDLLGKKVICYAVAEYIVTCAKKAGVDCECPGDILLTAIGIGNEHIDQRDAELDAIRARTESAISFSDSHCGPDCTPTLEFNRMFPLMQPVCVEVEVWA